MRAVWNFAQLEESYVVPGFGFLTRSGLLNRRVGITCPNCRSDFRVVQKRIRIVRISVWVTFALVAAATGWLIHSDRVTHGYLLYAALFIAANVLNIVLQFFTPYLATVRLPRQGEIMSFPLRSAYRGSERS